MNVGLVSISMSLRDFCFLINFSILMASDLDVPTSNNAFIIHGRCLEVNVIAGSELCSVILFHGFSVEPM